ncbi:MAG: LuxR C-terminal-related transcriptional regulator [Ilumatobacteraceae bacterium]
MLRGRTGLSPVMIGRRNALARLHGLVDAAPVGADLRAADGPEIALVSGEAGIGKTRLLREFIEALPADVTVLSAQARPGSMGRPLDVMGQLADNTNDPAEVRQVVEDAAARGRAVLVVEDLHWADAESAHVLEQICNTALPQLVVVGSYRGTDLSRKAPGGELVLRLERQHNVEQVRLDRLDRQEVGAMLAAISGTAPSSGSVDAVYRRSGGIPFVVEELIRCCGPDACIDDLKTAQLPWSLDEAVRQQLAGLDADERSAADALAVYGDPAPFDVLAVVAEMEEQRLLAALRSLVARGVVVETADDTFWFAHALVADAVHQQLLGRERRRLHERSLAALRGRSEPDHAALARHALGAGQFDLIPSIAREGARRYLDRGASFQALRLAVEALAEAPDDPELLAVATDAAWRLEFGQEALTYAQRWERSAVTDLDRVESMRFIARVHHEQLEPAERDAVLARMEALADSLPTGMARGRAAGAVAQLHMLAYRVEQAVAWADRALDEARRNGDQWLEAQASVERASAADPHSPMAQREQALLDAYELARRVDDGVLQCRVLNNLLGGVGPHGPRGEWARAEIRRVAGRTGLDKFGAGSLAQWEAGAALAAGDMRRVRLAVAEAAEHNITGGKEHHEPLALLIQLRLEEGLVAEARTLMAGLACDPEHPDEDDHHGDLRSALTAALLDGHGDEARRLFEQVLLTDPAPDSSWTTWHLIDIGLAALAAGIPAPELRSRYLDGWLAAQVVGPFVARHLEGPLRLAGGDPAGAVAALREVLSPPDPSVFVPIVGSLQTQLASALLATGERAAALEAARASVTTLARWPGWRRDRAEALVRRLEGSTRADGELTAREREVASLIAEGLTNGQLAERLYISPKTAAVHVSNILTKLGLSSRVEIAAWAVRHGLLREAG